MNINMGKDIYSSYFQDPDLFIASPNLQNLQQNSWDNIVGLEQHQFELEPGSEYHNQHQQIQDHNQQHSIKSQNQSPVNQTFVNSLKVSEPSSQLAAFDPISSMIIFLVDNDRRRGEELISRGAEFFVEDPVLEEVFKILIEKFRKLRKTKQQMTKFCMRKALKFHWQKSATLKQKNRKMNVQPRDFMPFKKNSPQKTMNIQFMKQIFSDYQFTKHYKQFLQQLPDIIAADNREKMKYLTKNIQTCIQNGSINNLNFIKRLPWTRSILNKTQQLARSFLQYVPDPQ